MAELKNYHPHSRFSLHERANLYPFRDLIWGRTDGPFIDLKVDFPDPANNYADGSAFLRCEDVIEMGHVLGMATQDEVQALKKEIEFLKKQVAAIPFIVESYKNELSGTTERFLTRLASGYSGDLSVGVARVPVPEDKHETPDSNQPSLFDSEQNSDEGSGGNHSDSVKSDESDAGPSTGSNESNPKSSAKSPKRKGSDDVPIAVSDDSLADFLGLGDK